MWRLHGAWVVLAAAAVATPAQPPASPTPPPTLVITTEGRPTIAIACTPASDGDSRQACDTVTDVLRRDIEFEDALGVTANRDAATFVLDMSLQAASALVLEATVRHVPSREKPLQRRYSQPRTQVRDMAHRLSNDVLALVQVKGVARTRIAFTSDRGQMSGRSVKHVYVVDYDGARPESITTGRYMRILPTWSPDARRLAYVGYTNEGGPDIFMNDVAEGRQLNLTQGRAGNYAPTWSSDGTRLAYASSRRSLQDIFVQAVDGGDAHPLTSGSGMNTAPAWSPTGREIAFTSDRTGEPAVYVMGEDGTNVRRVSPSGMRGDGAAWNPANGAELAFTVRRGGLAVDVLDLASGQVHQVSPEGVSCEQPTWAPNGRHLAFACLQGDRLQITIAAATGGHFVTLDTGPGNNEQPDWSR